MNNFQSIRNDLFEEVAVVVNAEQRNAEMAEIAEVLDARAQQRKTTIGPYQDSDRRESKASPSSSHDGEHEGVP